MLAMVLLTASLAVAGAHGLSAAHLVLPSLARLGNEVKMACTFELDEGEVVYSIKWFKDEQLFLTVTPGDQPPLKVVELPGIFVDRKGTAYNKLVLGRVEFETAGTYRCLVSLDGPSFATARSTKVLKVVKER
ncbi:uncharacterized protein LOC111261025 [Varroa jacobsoni]|uniref:Ig-like domain-containing protein n=1 Tax=Varroa destructor TaxID=109461 RepID=A0A7M7K9Y9_VARDE|nr:uncharacterized protein LOC111251417 [Varroa destructor]XP_022689938.1 uncharacterized protein LOC111261025 [Varroa jacobsoni]